LDKSGKILGKTYFRDPEVNKGFYSKKRDGVADVDPKVILTKSYRILGNGAIRANSRQATQTGSHRPSAQTLCIAQH
jgi:hypothetical protein